MCSTRDKKIPYSGKFSRNCLSEENFVVLNFARSRLDRSIELRL